MEVTVKRICYYGGTRHYPESSRHRTAGRSFVLKDVKDFSDQYMVIVNATPGEKKAAFANLKAKEEARELGIAKRREVSGRISHGEPVPSMALPEVPKEKTKPVPEPGDPGYEDESPALKDETLPAGDAPPEGEAPPPVDEAPPADEAPPEGDAPPADPKPEKPKKPVGRPPKKK